MSKNKIWLNILSTKKGKVFLKPKTWETNNFFTKGTKTEAWLKGNYIGEMSVEHPVKHGGAKYSWVKDTKVNERFRKLGISSRMMKESLKSSKGFGSEFLRTQEILHPAQIDIREKYKSKFLGYGLGKYQEGTAIISPSRARMIVGSSQKYSRYVGSVRASTKIPKDIDKIPRPKISKDKRMIRFVRINGKIRPIRVKE